MDSATSSKRPRGMGPKAKIAICLFYYVVCIGLFALLYWRMYAWDVTVFSYSSEILLRQRTLYRQAKFKEVRELETQVSELEDEIRALSEFETYVKARKGRIAAVNSFGPGFTRTTAELQTEHYRVDFVWTQTFQRDSVQTSSYLVIKEGERTVYHNQIAPSSALGPGLVPTDYEGCSRVAAAHIQDRNARLSSTRELLLDRTKDLTSIGDTSARVWSFWDFLYFSTITQTTVGYGDILPNDTSVRFAVMLQIMIGLLITTFGLNFVVAGDQNSGGAPVQTAGEKTSIENL